MENNTQNTPKEEEKCQCKKDSRSMCYYCANMISTPQNITSKEKVQCNDCLTIFTGIGDEFCPECSGTMSVIINTSDKIEEECNHETIESNMCEPYCRYQRRMGN